MKKFFKYILLYFCFILSIFPSISLADEIDYLDTDETLNISSVFSNLDNLSSINSRAYVVLDRISNTILLGKNQFTKVKMASTTKIMTAIIVLENSDLKQIVEVSKKAANTGGSRLGLTTGTKISINDLLYGLMLCSGNDAAVALAETVSGSIENFSKLMNQKAKQLNLENTHFESPHGLDSPEHYTTAYELALLSNYALQNKTFAKIVNTKNHTITLNGYPKNLSNTNELLGYLNGVYGIKTGFTNGANRCLVTACKRDTMDIICVVLGADTKKFRTQDSIKLIEYSFKNFEYIDLKEVSKKHLDSWKINNLDKIIISKGTNSNIDICIMPLEKNLFPIRKKNIEELSCEITFPSIIDAPILENDILGYLKIKDNNSEIANIPIISNSTIFKKDIYYYFLELFKNYQLTLNSILL